MSTPEPRPSAAERRYRQLAIITTAGICLLVVAGGVVRLTGSGLGCDDWPRCNDARFVDVSSGHTAIEQVNRLLSGVIGLPTLLLVVVAYRLRRRRPELRWPAIGVLVSILANGVVGGLAVLGDLHPALVQSHFLLAMVSIVFGLVAVDRVTAGRRSDDALGRTFRTWTRTQQIVALLSALSALALVTGTVVTGAGPHAGDEDVRRYGFDISVAARVHSVSVILALLVALGLAVWLRSHDVERSQIGGHLSTWTFVGLLQGAVGYTQYFNGVPEILVALHIALATALWVVTVRMAVRASTPTSEVLPVGISREPVRTA